MSLHARRARACVQCVGAERAQLRRAVGDRGALRLGVGGRAGGGAGRRKEAAQTCAYAKLRRKVREDPSTASSSSRNSARSGHRVPSATRSTRQSLPRAPRHADARQTARHAVAGLRSAGCCRHSERCTVGPEPWVQIKGTGCGSAEGTERCLRVMKGTAGYSRVLHGTSGYCRAGSLRY
jgi:hypothetical protein